MAKRIISILLIIILLLVVAYFSFQRWTAYQEMKRKIAWKALGEKISQEIIKFPGETGIVIKDLRRGWQILNNPDKLFASASLVKVPIMASCFYAADNEKIDLKESLTLKAEHKSLGSGSLKDAPLGGEFSIEQLIGLMISESDNTATNMLIDFLGFDYLNTTFKKLGLQHTNISRKMMDFRSRRTGKENFTTASDLVGLFEKIYRGKLINKSYSPKCLVFLKQQEVRDRIPARLPQTTVVAHKTGLERRVCHDCGIVFTSKGDFLICVLTQHKDKTAKKAKEFIAELARQVYDYYQSF